MSTRENTLTRVIATLRTENARMSDSIASIARLSVEPRTPRKVQSVRPIRPESRKPSILIVEDEESTGRMYEEALSARAHVFRCRTMVEARTAVAAFYDVAIVDLLMREDPFGGIANGADLIPLIRARSPETRIIVSTGMQDEAAREALLVAGVDPSTVEIVPKVPPHELRKVVGAR